MGPMNLAGGGSVPETAPEIDGDHLLKIRDSVTVIDTRDRAAFASGHVSDSIWIGKGDSFSAWVGWLTDIDDPLVLIVDDETDPAELQTELARVGYDEMVGWMRGVGTWIDAGGETSTLEMRPLVEWVQDTPAQVLDVRDGWEREQMPLNGAVGIHLPDIDAESISSLDRAEPVGVVCASGYRATIAGSLLERIGVTAVVLSDKGVAELRAPAVTGS
jgi:rhodanese-related sulfurtransferase